MKNKFISLFAAMCMIIGILPQAVFAAGGSGTAADPYVISSADDLLAFAEKVNDGSEKTACAVLDRDIDLSEICGATAGEGGTEVSWTPIGNKTNQFSGTFDGQGHTIRGLYVNNPAADYQGLFGYNYSGAEVKNLAVVGTVSGKQKVGGIVGENRYCKVTNCSFSGTVSGSGNVGGVVGAGYTDTISNCYNTGAVSGDSYYVGGVVGASYNNGKVSNCYYLDTAAKGGINGADNAGKAEAKTTEQLASGEVAYLLQGAQTEQVWGQTIGTDTYPKFFGPAVYAKHITCGEIEYTNNSSDANDPIPHKFGNNGICTICGAYEPVTKVDGVYQISNPGQLKSFADLINGGVEISAKGKLMNDIDLSSVCGEDKGSWKPIGNEAHNFTGTFDGQGHTIKGLYINNSAENYQGLFGYSWRATIQNLAVVGTVSGKDYVGGVLGENRYGTVTSSSFSGEVSGTSYVSGVTGRNYSGTVTSSSFSGKVSGTSNIGGVAGRNYFGTVTNCYNTGAVSGDSNYVGGVVGYNYTDSTVTNCYNTGAVSGDSYYVGGVAGYNYTDSTVTNCYNTGTVTGIGNVGGVIGYNYSGTVTNCYYLTGTAAGGINKDNVKGQAEAKTAEQFASGEVAYLLNGSKSDNDVIWKQTIGKNDYPGFTGLIVYYDEAAAPQYYNTLPTCTNTVLKKITAAETKDGSTATAVLSEIQPNGNTINSITWSCGELSAAYAERFGGNLTVSFGIVVPELLTAEESGTTDQITVDMK